MKQHLITLGICLMVVFVLLPLLAINIINEILTDGTLITLQAWHESK
jgi:hypothetical protein